MGRSSMRGMVAVALLAATALGGGAVRAGNAAAPPRLYSGSAELVASIRSSLTAVLHGDEAAKKKLLSLAADPGLFRAGLDGFIDRAKAAGATQSVTLTGVELAAVLWYGLVPVGRVDLYLWDAADGFRVARFEDSAAPLPLFDAGRVPVWRDPVARGFGEFARQVIRRATAGHCEDIPTVRGSDFEPVLPTESRPRKQTLVNLQTARFAIAPACHRLRGVPFGHVTWQLGEVGGVIHRAQGDPLAFRIALGAGGDGSVRLMGIDGPVAPRKP